MQSASAAAAGFVVADVPDPAQAAVRAHIVRTPQSFTTILNGIGPPRPGLGVAGDFYIDRRAYSIYGPKSARGWGKPTSLIGPAGATGGQGAPGAQGAVGTSSAPGSPLGAAGFANSAYWGSGTAAAPAPSPAIALAMSGVTGTLAASASRFTPNLGGVSVDPGVGIIGSSGI
jgi:integrin beta 8